MAGNPSCACTYCTVNYHCPTCTRKKEVKIKCRLEAETKAKKEAELHAKEKMEKEREERGHADEMAGAVFEFFASLLPQVMPGIAQAPTDMQGDDMDSEPELLPVPSPDSITVTTVFGVHEEPNNITTISASGPPPSVSAYEEFGPEEEILGNLNASIEQMHLADYSTVGSGDDASVQVEPEDLLEDDGDDADIDTDDFDAESALIDEFIDDGALTPTTTTTASNA